MAEPEHAGGILDPIWSQIPLRKGSSWLVIHIQFKSKTSVKVWGALLHMAWVNLCVYEDSLNNK